MLTGRRCPQRRCQQCGGFTLTSVICAECYAKTAEGRNEKARRKRYAVLEDAGACATCQHWCGKCDLGLPEGGTRFADDCPAKVSS